MSDELIANKADYIENTFSKTEIDLFKVTETICGDEKQYLSQYKREISLVLTKFNEGSSMVLSTSSYFSISNWEGIPIRIRIDKDRLDRMKKKSRNTIETRVFSQTFDIEQYFDIELPVMSKDL